MQIAILDRYKYEQKGKKLISFKFIKSYLNFTNKFIMYTLVSGLDFVNQFFKLILCIEASNRKCQTHYWVGRCEAGGFSVKRQEKITILNCFSSALEGK